MKKKTFFKFLVVLTVILSVSGLTLNAQIDYHPEIDQPDSLGDTKYQKHIFYVERVSFESGSLDGRILHTAFVLLGRGTCNIPNEEPAKRVNINFYVDSIPKAPYYDSRNKSIYLYYPESSYDKIKILLLSPGRLWAQFFYLDANKKSTYGDIHGDFAIKQKE